jgi:class 3 adenylate cyclase
MPVFLFTDIENSTGLWEEHYHAMEQALHLHNAIIDECVLEYGGEVVKHMGDGVFAVFDGGDPLTCTLHIQRQVGENDWGTIGDLRVRAALNAGEAIHRDDDYFGPAVNRTARLNGIGWGGQTLLTPEVLDWCALPQGAKLQDLGVHLLKDLSRPVQVYALVHPALGPQEFPPLRSLSSMHPQTLLEALHMAREFDVVPLALYAMVGVARLLAYQGESEYAAELLGLVTSHPVSSTFAKDKAWQLLSELEATLPPDTLEASQARGATRDLPEVIADILGDAAR